MTSKEPYPIGTIVRIKRTGQFARIESVAKLLDGTLLHYEGPIEGKPPGNYYLGNNDDVELELLPPNTSDKVGDPKDSEDK
jgi:hypothetical protein